MKRTTFFAACIGVCLLGCEDTPSGTMIRHTNDADGDCNPACLSNEVCINHECQTRVNCSENQVLVNNTCVDKKPCDPSCDDDEVCVDGNCVRNDGSECNPPCNPDQVCVNKICTGGNTTKICDPECDSDHECVDGVCQPLDPCAKCKSGEICTNDGECVPKPECDKNQVQIAQFCVDGNTCNPACSTGEICINGVCVKGDDSSCDPQCSENEVCIGGKCVHGSTCVPDCGTGEVCIYGVCVKGDDSKCDPACGDHAICIQGVCVHGTTCSPVCSDDLVCINGECVKTGDSQCNPECDSNHVCVNGVCVPGSVCSYPCRSDELCVSGVCVKGSDNCDPACAEDQICLNGQCVGSTCNQSCASGLCMNGTCVDSDSDSCNPACKDNEICINGKCVNNGTCKPLCEGSTVCANDTCVPGVVDVCDPECFDNEVCVNGKCISKGSYCAEGCGDNKVCIVDKCVDGSTCDPACEDGSLCVNGYCVTPGGESTCGLETTAGCLGESQCLNGNCVIDTTCKPDCEKGSVCINGVCVSGDGSKCDPACADNQVCVQNKCIHGNSCSPDCDGKGVCVNGICLTNGEETCEPACNMLQVCVNGVCTNTNECLPSCRTGYVCINGVCLSSEGDCEISCQTGYACFGKDQSGASVCVPSTTCDPLCKDNEVCINGTCVGGQTNDCNETCPEGEVCHNGKCIAGKPCDPACDSDQICINGTCVNSGNCDPACAFHQVCVNDTCVDLQNERCVPECNEHQTCIYGKCIDGDDGTCNPACPVDKICKDGKCVDGDDGSCNPECPEGKVCRDRKCMDADDGTCDPECESPKVCQNGQCVDGDDGSCDPECKEGYFCQQGVCMESCKTSGGVRCGSLCCEGNTPICDDVEKVCLVKCSEAETRCNDELCCNNETEFCIYGKCQKKEDHDPCDSAKDCDLDAFCEAVVGMCISEDDVPKDCKRSTETYPFEPKLMWNWPKDLTNGSAAGKSNWYDSVDSYNVMATPIVINLTDDNGDGKVNENDIPEIVFATFRTSSSVKNSAGNAVACYSGVSSVRAITTNDKGELIELAASAELFHGEEDLGAADIDNDGYPEIIAGTPSELHALRLVKDTNEKTGYRWETPYKLDISAANGNVSHRVAASFADLEADGVVDIITNQGVAIVNNGKLEWKKNSEGKACKISFGSHTAADLNGDGKMEIIGGGSIFDASCNKLIETSELGGQVSVADLLKDSPDAAETGELIPEIATVSGNTFRFFKIYNKNDVWSVKNTWSQAIPVNKKNPHYISSCKTGSEGHCNAAGGPPVIADFNGDTIPDVGVASRYYYVVFSNDGTPTGGKVLWADSGTQDWSSAVTGSSVFDFQGDGVAEILYADEINLYVYNGPGGTQDADGDGFNDASFIIGRSKDAAIAYPHTSGTAYEYPIIVDMDNDGKSELIHASNRYSSIVNANDSKAVGISVYKDTLNRWVRTRRIWNQHDYHVTNINEDGTVPLHEQPNWLQKNLNNFRQNVQPAAIEAAPNLTPKILSYSIGNCPDQATLIARFLNNGGLGTSDDVIVTFYAKDENNNDVIIGQVEHKGSTIPGTPITLTFTWNFKSLDGKVTFDPYKQIQIFYSVDTPDDSHTDGMIIECREDDNVSDMISVSCPATAVN